MEESELPELVFIDNVANKNRSRSAVVTTVNKTISVTPAIEKFDPANMTFKSWIKHFEDYCTQVGATTDLSKYSEFRQLVPYELASHSRDLEEQQLSLDKDLKPIATTFEDYVKEVEKNLDMVLPDSMAVHNVVWNPASDESLLNYFYRKKRSIENTLKEDTPWSTKFSMFKRGLPPSLADKLIVAKDWNEVQFALKHAYDSYKQSFINPYVQNGAINEVIADRLYQVEKVPDLLRQLKGELYRQLPSAPELSAEDLTMQELEHEVNAVNARFNRNPNNRSFGNNPNFKRKNFNGNSFRGNQQRSYQQNNNQQRNYQQNNNRQSDFRRSNDNQQDDDNRSENSRSNSRERSTRKMPDNYSGCFICKRKNHFKKDCFYAKNGRGN